MFSGQSIFTLLVLLAWGVIMQETSLFLLSLALLLATTLSGLWGHYCLTRIEYRRRFNRRQAAFGEEVVLEVEVVNRKLLPLSWLEIDDEIPTCMAPTHGQVIPSYKPGRSLLVSLISMRPYERIRRRYVLPCTTRGEHLFGRVRLRSGDLFGFSARQETLPMDEAVVVYPRVVPLTRLGLPARHPLGDFRTTSWLFEDVSRVAGAREYRAGDGLRRIHWPASARTQQLQTRVYEATTSFTLGVFLNVTTSEDIHREFDHFPEVLELTITTAASIANWGLEQGFQTGVYTNGLHRLGKSRVVVPASRDSTQLERILLALGRLQPVAADRFEEMLAGESRGLPFGTTAVMVTAALHPAAAAEALALRSRGHAVTVVLTGRATPEMSLPGILLRRVGPPEAWREMPALSLSGGNGRGG